MTGGFLDLNIFRGLAFRMLLFLTLALLPFGLISVVQTREIVRQAESNAELSLLALTDQAASAEQSIFQEAFGAAEALSALAQLYARDARACSAFLGAYRQAAGIYSFIGYLPPDGMMQCSSSGNTYDFSDFPGFAEEVAAPRRHVLWSEDGVISEEPVMILSQPFFTRAGFAGFMVLSVPVSAINAEMLNPLEDMPVRLLTFNVDGEIVRSDSPFDETGYDLPAGRDLSALVSRESIVFEDINKAGQERLYAVVPIVANVAYAMTIWRPEELAPGLRKSVGLSMFLPVIMWLASLVVAFWTLNRLAVRHIRKLGRQMRLFAYNRRVPRSQLGPSAPRELEEIQKVFVRMAESIIRDEAALEDGLRDKNILLKEVHHRVKNNLQLISSIMSMQIRRAQSEDAKKVLQRLQERILSLATVHKNLYQTEELDRVDAGQLAEEIMGQLLSMGLSASRGVEVEQSYESIEMDADDAAPLTLLMSEAVTNAMKYIGTPPDGGPPRLEISLFRTKEGEVCFRVANSTSGAVGSEGTGLGTQLISAFTRQLGGTVDVGFEASEHWMLLTFPLRARKKINRDY